MRKACLLALGLAACAHSPMIPEAPASLAAAETEFGRHSMREDMRVAFLANFADDGVFVRDGWRVSNDWLRPRPAPPIVLDWHPQYVETASSGDLGLSTGPWTLTSRKEPSAPAAHGQYVSVWRRESGGPWKVAVDLGIGHPQQALWDAPLEARSVPAGATSSGGDLEQAEARFAAESVARGARVAYAAAGADDLRFYREGYAPLKGRAAALAAASMDDERLAWVVERSETARSGDFGYARGHYARAGDAAKPAGWFLRVWRREAAGWRIVMDVTNPGGR
jgi:ketosteroid isomerase-like protein